MTQPPVLKSLEPKLYEVTDDVEVLGIEGNQRGTDTVAGKSDKDIVEEGDFLALEVGALQNNFDGGVPGFFPVLVGRVNNPY